MNIIAGMHVHNGERWVGYAVASIYNGVDKIVIGISEETDDKTRTIVNEIKSLNPAKLVVYNNHRTDLVPGGFGVVKTEMIKKCGEAGADWILSMDFDHLYYPLGNKLNELAKESEANNVTAVKFRQYFLYHAFRTLPLDPEVNEKAKKPGYSMFASFFKYTDSVIVTGEVHETVRGVGEWTFKPSIDFVHIGPFVDDWVSIEKEYFYSGMQPDTLPKKERKPFNEWMTGLQKIDFYPKCLLDFVARRRLEYDIMVPLTKVKPEGTPPVLEYYYNGRHELDIKWLKEYIGRGK